MNCSFSRPILSLVKGINGVSLTAKTNNAGIYMTKKKTFRKTRSEKKDFISENYRHTKSIVVKFIPV